VSSIRSAGKPASSPRKRVRSEIADFSSQCIRGAWLVPKAAPIRPNPRFCMPRSISVWITHRDLLLGPKSTIMRRRAWPRPLAVTNPPLRSRPQATRVLTRIPREVFMVAVTASGPGGAQIKCVLLPDTRGDRLLMCCSGRHIHSAHHLQWVFFGHSNFNQPNPFSVQRGEVKDDDATRVCGTATTLHTRSWMRQLG
jgi:hypothetical protein